jgi:hypothetical protein
MAAPCACIHLSLSRSLPTMPRKPNYDFDRRRKEQERKTKKENKRAERQQRRDERRVEDTPAPETTDEK